MNTSKPPRLARDYTDWELRRMFAALPLGRMVTALGPSAQAVRRGRVEARGKAEVTG